MFSRALVHGEDCHAEGYSEHDQVFVDRVAFLEYDYV